MPSDRPSLRATLDESTLDLWHAYCDRHGVTISAVVEAIGRRLDPALDQPAFLDEVLADARRIMVARFDRRPTES